MTLSDLNKSRTTIIAKIEQLRNQSVVDYDVWLTYHEALGIVAYNIRQIETYGFLKEAI